MELAIDTSTEVISLALSNKGEVVAEHTWHTGQNHTAQLLPSLLHVLHQDDTSLQDITGIIVAKGPGSFNGVRVGIATAKGLSFALDIPLVAISTLEVMAFPYSGIGRPICPILNAGRGDVAAALFQARNGKWLRLVEEHITNIDGLCSEIAGKVIFSGEINSQMALEIRLRADALIMQGSAFLRRAGYLAELGWYRLKADDLDDPATLQPLYLRRPSVTIPKRR